MRAAVEGGPDKVLNISWADYKSFWRSIDMFVVGSMVEATNEVVVLADSTLRTVSSRTKEVPASVKAQLDAKLMGGLWVEASQLSSD